MAARRTRKDDGSNWTVADSRGVYGIRHWGAGYFAINDGGNVEVRPQGADSTPIDLYELVGQLREAGLSLPLLVRFPDILQDRVRKLTGAFDANIERLEYQSRYTALYPIKVNQQEAVVENIIATENVSIGLEAGSKPELMAVLALAPKGGTIVCNGYKDREFIKLALMGQKLGHNVFIVIEKESEVQLVIEEAASVGVQPQVGLRVRLSSLASSKWADTGGEKAKFGLSAAQLLSVVERFRQAGLDQGVRLLHFHMGSQIANLADYQHGFKEAIRYYGELRALGLPVDHIDVGGGLGVDYDGTHSRNASSINYDIDDYAGVVVGMLKEFCDAQGLPHPHIFSESGRALTAHHAVLITQVTDVERHNDDVPKIVDPDEQPEIVRWLAELLGPTDAEMVTETYWRATHYIGDAAAQYADGKISLAQKALAEQCYFAICRRLHNQLKARQRSHRQVLDELNDKLADKYICNFSVFQSLPDTWAIGQVLPILPLHRLGEEPDRRGIAGPDLRLRRQDHPVRRRAEHRDQPAGARGEGGRGLPDRGVPGRRLPGDPRRHAQPVRRHRLGERLPARRRRHLSRRHRDPRHHRGHAALRAPVAGGTDDPLPRQGRRGQAHRPRAQPVPGCAAPGADPLGVPVLTG